VTRLAAAAALHLGLHAQLAIGQEALLMPSATQPSPATVLLRQQVRMYYGSQASRQVSLPATASFGVAPGHSISVGTMANFSPSSASGLSDASLSWKWRVHSLDTGPVDTSRTAIIAGLQIPSGTTEWSTGSFNPSAGVVHTRIAGRMGLGASLEYKLNTGRGAANDITGTDGSTPATIASGSALWRVHPVKYTASTPGAWYAGLEGASVYSGPGFSVRLGPVLMFESSSWVIEAGWQIYPVNTGGMVPVRGMAVAGFRWFF